MQAFKPKPVFEVGADVLELVKSVSLGNAQLATTVIKALRASKAGLILISDVDASK